MSEYSRGPSWAELSNTQAQLEEAQDEVHRLRALRQHGCNCSDEEACQWMQERDAALARVAELEREVERLRETWHWLLDVIRTTRAWNTTTHDLKTASDNSPLSLLPVSALKALERYACDALGERGEGER